MRVRLFVPIAAIAAVILAAQHVGDAALPPGDFLIAVSKDGVFQKNVPGQAKTSVCMGRTVTRIVNNKTFWKIDTSNDGTAPDCDEAIFLNGTLEITRSIISRDGPDFRGCFEFRWVLKNPAGKAIASGSGTGTDNVGTHRHPLNMRCEECESLGHFEAALTGVVSRGVRFNNFNISGAHVCATVAHSEPAKGEEATLTIEGLVIARCPRAPQ